MLILAYRTGKFGICNALLVRATVDEEIIKNTDELIAHLTDGVTRWAAETSDGASAYAYAGSDMNIGDLSNYDLRQIVERCPSILELSIEDVSFDSSFTYDTSLCRDLETEDYDHQG